LETERNSNNGYAQEYSCNKVICSQEKSAEDKPNYVSNRVLGEIRSTLSAHWPYSKSAKFKALKTKRNTDNGHAPKCADYKPSNGRGNTYEQKPKDITDNVKKFFHFIPPVFLRVFAEYILLQNGEKVKVLNEDEKSGIYLLSKENICDILIG
jgi:hypothetical protein